MSKGGLRLDGWFVLGNSINGLVAVVCLKTKNTSDWQFKNHEEHDLIS